MREVRFAAPLYLNLEKKMTIHIFRGSLTDLERMTGKQFEAVLNNDGTLVECSASRGIDIISPEMVKGYSWKEQLSEDLTFTASKKGYAGYVHVVFERQFEGRDFPNYIPNYVAFGYPIKEKSLLE